MDCTFLNHLSLLLITATLYFGKFWIDAITLDPKLLVQLKTLPHIKKHNRKKKKKKRREGKNKCSN